MRLIGFMTAIVVATGASAMISAAQALDPGKYECQVRKSLGVKGGTGEKIKLPDAPVLFQLEIGEGPVFGDQLRENPLRRTDVYEPEPRPTFVARISATMFATPADRLISFDRRTFSDAEMSLVLSDDGEYLAYGSPHGGELFGVAIYAGACSPSGNE